MLATATVAEAGAWTQSKGRSQVILKYEQMRADEAFGDDGERLSLSSEREDRAASVFAEYGLTDRLTLQFKGEWQSGEDAFFDYDGRGPVEIGVTWQAWRDDRTAISLYAGYAQAGDGRNAGYAAPGVGDHDWEVRGSVGRSMGGFGGRRGPERTFAELQVARRMRDGLPDETRLDVTLGAHFGEDWMVLGQAYGGLADDPGVDPAATLDALPGARWLSLEASAVRNFGAWSVQAGWRHAVAGRQVPVAAGPVFAIWRRF